MAAASIVTGAMLKEWKTGGQDELGKLLSDLQDGFIEADGSGAASRKFQTALHDMTSACIDNEEMEPESVAHVLLKHLVTESKHATPIRVDKDSKRSGDAMEDDDEGEGGVKGLHPLTQSAIVDVLWLRWTEDMPGKINRFVALIVSCLETDQLFPSSLLKERLQGDLLEAVGLEEAGPFRKAFIKWRTKRLYRQQKFTLLREESEGYSKLITTLNSFFASPRRTSSRSQRRRRRRRRRSGKGKDSMVDDDDDDDDDDDEDSKNNPNTVSAADMLLKLKGMIGFFDLDPNRVIDMVLEAFERAVPDSTAGQLDNLLSLLAVFNRASVCHVLGFKMQSYYKNDQECPSCLLDLTAELLRGKVFTLGQLYPHLSPSDDEMIQRRSKLLARKTAEAKAVGVVHLKDSEKLSPEEERRAEQEKLDKEAGEVAADRRNLKLGVLAACLRRKDMATAKLLLDRMEALVPASFPAISQELARLAGEMLEAWYAPIAQAHRCLSSSKRNKASANDKSTWKDVESDKTGSLVEMSTELWAILKHLNIYMYRHPLLMAKVCRVLKHLLTEKGKRPKAHDPSYKLPRETEHIVAECLIPAHSLSPGNVGLSAELWSVLYRMPYETRYRLYGYWKDTLYDKYPEMRLTKAVTTYRTKYFTKRISTANNKGVGRLLAKFCLSNPLVVFDRILRQVQAFDNQILPVVDACKYITPLCYDVITFVLLDQMSGVDSRTGITREKLKNDGINEAQWFQSLTTFTGHFYRKYTAELDSALRFVVHQLKQERSLDLLVLRELITHMGGVEALEDNTVTEAQLQGQAGGKTLRSETEAKFRGAKTKKRPSAFLLDALTKGKLVTPLLVLLSQQKQSIAYRTESPHIKHITELLDKSQSTLTQLLHFVSVNMTDDKQFAAQLPPLKTLCQTYRVTPTDAFHALRRVLRLPGACQGASAVEAAAAAAAAADDEVEKMAVNEKEQDDDDDDDEDKRGNREVDRSDQPSPAPAQGQGAAEEQEEEEEEEMLVDDEEERRAKEEKLLDAVRSKSRAERETREAREAAEREEREREEAERKEQERKEKEAAKEKASSSSQAAVAAPKPKKQRSKVVSEELIDTCRDLLPAEAWSAISPEFYATFWALRLYDLYLPESQYTAMIGKFKGLIVPSRQKAKMSSKQKKEQDRHVRGLQTLKDELVQQSKQIQHVRSRLRQAKDVWLADVSNRSDTITVFLQHCVMPRCLSSGIDALYCARFIHTMHELGAAWFSTVHCYDKIMKTVLPVMSSVTSFEASRFGRFLNEILAKLQEWREDKALYKSKCMSQPGFAQNPSEPTKAKLSHEEFCVVFGKWHRLLAKSFGTVMASPHRTDVVNALLVLNKVGKHFPRVNEHGEFMEEALDKLIKDPANENTNIKVIATSALGQLSANRKNWVKPDRKRGGGGGGKGDRDKKKGDRDKKESSSSSSSKSAKGRSDREREGSRKDRPSSSSNSDKGSKKVVKISKRRSSKGEDSSNSSGRGGNDASSSQRSRSSTPPPSKRSKLDPGAKEFTPRSGKLKERLAAERAEAEARAVASESKSKKRSRGRKKDEHVKEEKKDHKKERNKGSKKKDSKSSSRKDNHKDERSDRMIDDRPDRPSSRQGGSKRRRGEGDESFSSQRDQQQQQRDNKRERVGKAKEEKARLAVQIKRKIKRR